MSFTRFTTLLFVLGLVLFSLAGYLYFTHRNLTSLSITSPLPKIFTTHSEVLAAETFWMPDDKNVLQSNIPQPKLSATEAISYDLTTNQLLYSKNIHQHHPIASITKIMTAIVALETEKTDRTVTVSHSAATIGEDSMGLSEGEKMPLLDMLYGMLLPSGNDAAEAIAQSSTVGRANFVYLMNKKAEDLGLTDTHFTNPSGLEGDGNQYSTPYDLLVITRYALQNPTFAQIVSTVNYDIPSNQYHKAYHLFNETNLLTSYPGVKGVKTGFTDEAGMCLVTYLDYGGHKIIAIVLNSDDRRGEMKELLDYSLKALGVQPPVHS